MSTILVWLCVWLGVGCLCFEQMMKQPYQELESTIFCLALFGLRLRPPHMPLPDVMTSTQGRIYDDKGTPLQKNFLVPNSQAPKLKIILGWLKAQYLLPSEVITFKHGGKLHLSTSLKCYWKCKEMLCRAIQYHFRPSFKKLYFRKWFCMGDCSQSSLAVRFTAKSGGYLFPWNE